MLCNKKKYIFSILSVINISVTIGLSFLVLSIPASMSSKTISVWHFLYDCILEYFYKISFTSIDYLIKAQKSFKYFNPMLSGLIFNTLLILVFCFIWTYGI